MRRFLKLLHVIGATGTAGGLAAVMLILTYGPPPGDIDAYAALRQSVLVLSGWIVAPGTALVVLSGLLALAAHGPFRRARWVWVKLGAGIVVAALTLVSVGATSRRAADAASRAAAGEISLADLQNTINDPWLAWWLLLCLATTNVVMAVWRPRLGQRGVL